MNDTFLKACRGEKTDYTPVWLMRQAGRYLPEYQKVRSKVDFLTLCKTPELAAEVTIQPVDILKVDVAILFSDILVPIEPMGMKLEFSESKGPILYDPIRNDIAVSKLRKIKSEEDVPFVMEAIKILVKKLNVPLIGFSGAPFTLATYMIEGGSSKNFINTKKMMFQTPDLYAKLMDKITDTVINYLQAQIDAGVHAIQVFDSWAGILSPYDFEKYALPYVQRIVSTFKGKVPVIYFAFNGSAMLKKVKQSGADVLGIDWRIDISDAVNSLGNDVVVQGNLDPCVLFGTKDLIREGVSQILQGAKGAKGHIFNLGHGILP
ncbi:MAG: uroporphyrinogen decarboxylase, partial [Nitrospirae bacterium GWC2_46_6]